MIKKRLLIISSCIALAFSGCGNNSKDDENVTYGNSTETENSTESTEADDDKNVTDIPETSGEDIVYEINTEAYENVQQFFDDITDDMLNACKGYPSLESYWNDPLVPLSQFNENVWLYGISVNEQTAMLLYVEGEKILIEYPFPTFRNFYQETPGLNVYDIDDDGMDEIIISIRTRTGHVRRYALLVCDYNEKWNTYIYDDYLQDIEAVIKYRYDKESKVITFLDNEGKVLWENELPEWDKQYPYKGVNFEDDMGFDAETFQMEVIPRIELETPLPYDPIKIIFNLGFANGEFQIVSYDIQPNDLYRG